MKIDETPSAKPATESPTGLAAASDCSEEVVKSRSEDDPETKPTPAPRHNRNCPVLFAFDIRDFCFLSQAKTNLARRKKKTLLRPTLALTKRCVSKLDFFN